MAISIHQRNFLKYKKRNLPMQLDRAVRRLAHLKAEARRFGLDHLLDAAE